jgi:hypothetical protein
MLLAVFIEFTDVQVEPLKDSVAFNIPDGGGTAYPPKANAAV